MEDLCFFYSNIHLDHLIIRTVLLFILLHLAPSFAAIKHTLLLVICQK